jgi:hypothetical protein
MRIRDPGCKNSDLGTGKNIPDPQHWLRVTQNHSCEWSLFCLRCGSGFIFSLNCFHNNPDPGDRLIADPAESGSEVVKEAADHPPGRLIRGLWASLPWRNKPTRTHSSPSTRSSCRTWKKKLPDETASNVSRQKITKRFEIFTSSNKYSWIKTLLR